MNPSQPILNAVNRATKARILLSGIPNEQQATHARRLIKEAEAELMSARHMATAIIVQAKKRDTEARKNRQITARSMAARGGTDWLGVAQGIVG